MITLNATLTIEDRAPRSAPVEAHKDMEFRLSKVGKRWVYLPNDPHNIRCALAKLGLRVRYDLATGGTYVGGLAMTQDRLRSIRFQIHDNFRLLPSKEMLREVILNDAPRNPFRSF